MQEFYWEKCSWRIKGEGARVVRESVQTLVQIEYLCREWGRKDWGWRNALQHSSESLSHSHGKYPSKCCLLEECPTVETEFTMLLCAQSLARSSAGESVASLGVQWWIQRSCNWSSVNSVPCSKSSWRRSEWCTSLTTTSQGEVGHPTLAMKHLLKQEGEGESQASFSRPRG